MSLQGLSVRSRVLLVLVAALAVSGAVAQAALACEVENSSSHAKYTTLQKAVTEAAAHNTLKVTGTCEGNTTIGKDLTVEGMSAAATTLKGTGSVSVVGISAGATVKITKLTITGGKVEAAEGAGIRNEGSLTLEHSTVSGNAIEEEGAGGGIYNNASLTLKHSTVSGNKAESGGGVFSEEGSLTLEHSTVSGNTGDYEGEGEGGGIYSGGSLTLNDSTVSANAAPAGGGIDSEGSATLKHSIVSDNAAGEDGGGGINAFRGTLVLEHTTVSGNRAPTGAGISAFEAVTTLKHSIVSENTEGGGISTNGGTITLEDSTVSANEGYMGGGLLNGGSATLNHSTVTDNTVEGAEAAGGGILNSGSLNLNHSTVSDNTAPKGGGVYNEGSLTLGASSSITKNKATAANGGGGIFDTEEAKLIEAGGTVTDNTPDNTYTEP